MKTLLSLVLGVLSVTHTYAANTYEPYTITTLAGAPSSGTADGQGTTARFSSPFGVALDRSGVLYVADTQNQTIRKVATDGTVTTFAGSPGQAGSADGKGAAARFAGPSGIATDSAGNVYVSEFDNHTVRKITPDGTVTTLAGLAGQTGSTDGKGSAARFSYLGYLAVDSANNVIVADYANQTIRKITPDGTVTTIAGAAGAQGSADGAALQARFRYPRGIAIDGSGNIFISDEQNNTIRELTTGGTVKTVAGKLSGGSNDGTGTAAGFNFPEGIGVDAAGNIYVSDSNNNLIRKVTPAGVVTTLAGTPHTSSTSDGTGSNALFETPYGMATDDFGTIYVTDIFGNNAVRKGTDANASGLSVTFLTVNGSSSPKTLPVDYPVVFEAGQNDQNDVVDVKVQWSVGKNGPWTDLDNGFGGAMIFNAHDNRYILTTNNYPTGSNLFFRAVASSAAKAPSISAPVGPFQITANKTHLPPTHFQIEGMTKRFLVFIAAYPLDFFATINSQATGLSARLQTTTTPEVETSWTDLNDGNGGKLTKVANGTFDLRTGKYPGGSGIYFRVVVIATNMADSISNAVGPFELTQNKLPTVVIDSPTLADGTGHGTDASPLRITASKAAHLAFTVHANDADGTVEAIQSYRDNGLWGQFTIGVDSPPYQTSVPTSQGLHTLQAVAIDNDGGRGSATIVIEIIADPAVAQTYKLTHSGDWNTASNWTPTGVPGPADTADLGTNTVSVGSGVHITVASLSGGNLTGADTSSHVTITKNFSWTGGTISKATLEIASGGVGLIKAVFGGSNFSLNNAAVTNNAGGTVNVDVDSFIDNLNIGFNGKSTGSSLTNAGTLNFASAKLEDQTVPPFLHDIIKKQATQKLQGLAAITNTGTCYLNGVVLGLSSLAGAAIASRDGSAEAAATAQSGFIQAGGVLDFGPLNQAGTIIGDVVVNGGTVTGSGAVVGNLTNNGGLIIPGHSAGVLSVTGNFQQASGGTLLLEVGGADANGPEYDQLQVGGAATLGGKLLVRTINGYTPDASTQFVPLAYGSASGKFASVSSNAALTIGSTGATLKVTGPNQAAGQLLNISTRLQIQGGDNGLTAGFIVTGPVGSTKTVIIRGLGPSIGVAGAISDPILELNGSGVHVVNDDWQQGDTSKIPNGFAPSNPKESVIVATLTVGSQGYSSFTAGLRDTQGQVGVGVVEVYDLNTDSAAQLANIATRGLVQTGADVLIGGFYVGGNEPATVLVRVTGPSLSNNGVSGALQDPLLELHDANGAVISNDNWRETQESEIAATGIPPSDEREPAILSTLVPGGYTAVVRGVNDTTGVAVIEAYNLQ